MQIIDKLFGDEDAGLPTNIFDVLTVKASSHGTLYQ